MTAFARYLDTIARINKLDTNQPVQWLFFSGMLFSSRDKWWGDFKYRSSLHEGIDITFYRPQGKSIRHFDPSIKVPAFASGRVLNICDDFLGQTLVVEYASSPDTGMHAVLTYAHVIPETSRKPGSHIEKNEVIAHVCNTAKNPQLPPHIHFSCFEVPVRTADSDLNWNLFSKQTRINMIHPLFL